MHSHALATPPRARPSTAAKRQGHWLRTAMVAASLGMVLAHACTTAPPSPHRQLLIVLDGLRPDYITPEVMPHLHEMGRRGVTFSNHHAVYPTVTRVNASSISTGTYPERHGLMGNSVFFPEVDRTRFLDTSDRANLLKIDAVTNGRLLESTTLGEILQSSGAGRLLVVSSGSTGGAFLLNPRVAGGAIFHPEYALPASFMNELRTQVGEPPPSSVPADARNRYAADSFLKVGLPRIDPSIVVLWLTDPDTTAHERGIGHPVTFEALRRLDRAVKYVEDGLSAAGVLDRWNIWVTSDHGFSTYTGAPDIEPLLAQVAGPSAGGAPRVVASGGAIYVHDHDRSTVSEIVAGLQRTEGVGAIFTRAARAGDIEGWVPGTLSFQVANWDHPRSADILFSPDWTDAVNAYGAPGTTMSRGVAGHGSTSPFDIHNPLIAVGPNLRRGAVVTAPSGNVDFAPSFLHLLGVAVPGTMQGRVLFEAFTETDSAPWTRAEEHSVTSSDGSYTVTAVSSVVETPLGTYRYLDRTHVVRQSR